MTKIEIRSGEVSVIRNGEHQVLTEGQALQVNDEILNAGDSEAVIQIQPSAEGQKPAILTLQPEAGAVLNSQKEQDTGVEQVVVVPTCQDGVNVTAEDEENAAAVLSTNTNCSMVGLFGAGLLGAGLAPGALFAGAGLALLASNNGGDDGTAVTAEDPSAPPMGVADSAFGLAGAVDTVSEGVAKTPAAPATQLLEPLAGGLATAGDALATAGASDPTGLVSTVAEVVGVSQSGSGSSESGVVGAINSVSAALASAVQDSPAQGLVSPVAVLLGSSCSGNATGVAAGVQSVGAVFAQDNSALAPLTADVLGPVLGDGTTPSGTGLQGTLINTASGLQALTAADSSLAPLDPVTTALADGLVTAADGLGTAGNTLSENSASDPSGVVELLAEVLGAPVQGGSDTGAGSGTANSSTAGVAGTLADVGAGLDATPLAPAKQVTSALADGVLTAGDALSQASTQDPSGVAVLLADTLGTSQQSSASDTGLVGGVNALGTGLSDGTAGGPLGDLIAPLSNGVGSNSGNTTGVATGLADVGQVLKSDTSPLAPLTAETLGPLVGTTSGASGGLSGTVAQVGVASGDITASGPLAPLMPVTDALASGTEALSSGLQTAGQTLADNSAGDPSGSVALVASLLGGDVNAPAPDSSSGSAPDSSNFNGAAGLLSDLGDGFATTALEPLAAVTDPLSGGLNTVGQALLDASANDPTGVTKLLADVLGVSQTLANGDVGVTGGLNSLGASLTEGLADTPLAPLGDALGSVIGSEGLLTTGLGTVTGALSDALGGDTSPLAPITADLLSPVLGQDNSAGGGSSSPIGSTASLLDPLTQALTSV